MLTDILHGRPLGFSRLERLMPEGMQLNGPGPCDPQILDPRAVWKVLLHGSLGAGEAYMDGWWDVADLQGMMAYLMESGKSDKFSQLWHVHRVIRRSLMNLQSHARAHIVAKAHYDIHDGLYRRMLDSSMTYTCGYWPHAHTLEEAQRAKLDLVCRKLGLKPGDRVLDIGCGFGSFAFHAATYYGASVVGVSLSEGQSRVARERCAGLPIEIRIQDYRHVDDGPFDHIASIGMFEAVGSKNFKTFMRQVRKLLKPGGRCVLHTIGTDLPYPSQDAWYDKYIFPNGELPSFSSIEAASHALLRRLDFHEFDTMDYPRTLRIWYDNFVAAWPDIQKLHIRFDDRFFRMWEYYLLVVAAAFQVRRMLLWQFVFCRQGDSQDYVPVR